MNLKANKKDKKTEPFSETTGHVWDGIEEYNNPLPRWWLWTFYATIVWAIVYMFFFPSWPLFGGAYSGLLEYSSRGQLQKELDKYNNQNNLLERKLLSLDIQSLSESSDIYQYATKGGKAIFQTHCAQCHGDGGAGSQGYPNLLDDDWLWGGTIEDIYTSIIHGIRAPGNTGTRQSAMPAFEQILTPSEISLVSFYVRNFDLNEKSQGRNLYVANCAVCHQTNGEGHKQFGTPNLSDEIWLHGSDEFDISMSIKFGRGNVMPAWAEKLSETQIRQVTLFVHQLGGGE